ncbi:hypothetical protein C8Q78DRAFT_324482 [Trametes maxima]|nr:hypothetical protein C8Q78DRAFT_324482 [Trametes maxima]
MGMAPARGRPRRFAVGPSGSVGAQNGNADRYHVPICRFGQSHCLSGALRERRVVSTQLPVWRVFTIGRVCIWRGVCSGWKSPCALQACRLLAYVCVHNTLPHLTAGAAAHVHPPCARGDAGLPAPLLVPVPVLVLGFCWCHVFSPSVRLSSHLHHPHHQHPHLAVTVKRARSCVLGNGCWARGARGSNRPLPKPLMRHMTVGRMLAGQRSPPAFRKACFPF